MHRSLSGLARRAGVLTATAPLAAVAMAAPAHALIINDSSPLVGITVGQVARLSTINIGDPNIIGDPSTRTCRVTLSILDDEGYILGFQDPDELPPGRASAVELSALKVGVLKPGERVPLRALVAADCPDEAAGRLLRSGLEIYDQFSDRTMIATPVLTPPPDQDKPQP